MMRAPRDSAPARVVTDLLLIAALWFAIILILDPRGDFPLNDDWSFGLAVRALLAGEGFRPTPWTAMPLLPQALWGSLFCLPAGFSFTALRLATLTAGLIALFTLYWTLRENGAGSGLALLGVGTLAGNPLFLPLSFGFMSDVHFLATALLALRFLMLDLRRPSARTLVMAAMLCALATLTRQLGLALALAFLAVAAWPGADRRLSRRLLRNSLPLLLSLLALGLFQLVMKAGPGLPALYGQRWEMLIAALGNPVTLGIDLAGAALKATLYLGLFLTPLWILQGGRGRWMPRAILLLLLLAALAYWRRSLPLLPNIIDPAGIGPSTLEPGIRSDPLPGGMWWALSLAAACAGAAMIPRLTAIAEERREEGSMRRFLGLSALLMLAPVAATGLFDRYLLPLIPLAILLSARRPISRAATRRVPAILALVLIGAFSVAGGLDYLNWNRARWELVEEYESGGGDREDLDGGFEYNNLRRAERGEDGLGLDAAPPAADHRLAFSAIPGWRVVASRENRRWLPPGRLEVLLLRRDREGGEFHP